MLKEIRRNKIIDLIKTRYSISNSELSQILSVTPETIRKDIQFLEDQGILKRTFGGIISLMDNTETINYDPSFIERNASNIEAKKRIAQFAVQKIENNDIIAIDASTTTLQIVQYLPEDKNITVVTNSFAVLTELMKKDGINIISVGGYFRKSSTSFLGSISNKSLENININKSFISGQAISVKRGLMDPNEAEADFKNALINASNEIILLVDSSKFNRSAPIIDCNINTFSMIISTQDLPKDIVNELQSLNINIILV